MEGWLGRACGRECLTEDRGVGTLSVEHQVGWKTDQIPPPPGALDAVLRALVVPAIAEIVPPLRRRVTARVESWLFETVLDSQVLEAAEPAPGLGAAAALDLTCRVWFRKTSVAGRLLVHVESRAWQR